MNLSLQIPIKDIENKVNAALTATLFDGYIDDDKDFKVTVTKRKPFAIKAELNTIFVEAPLRAELQIGMKTLRSLFMGLVKSIEEIDVDIVVQYEIRPDVNVQWKLVPRITGRCLWENDPKLEIAGLKLNLASSLQWVIDDQIRKVTKVIEKYLKEDLRIEQYVKLGWDFIQTPFQLVEEHDIWIHFNPNASPIYATPIQCQGGFLNTIVSVPMFPEIFIGEQPTASPLMSLPNFEPAAKLPEKSDLHLSAEANFLTLKKLAEGRSFDTENEWLKKITLHRADFHAENEVLVAQLLLNAELKVLGETEMTVIAHLDLQPKDNFQVVLQPFEIQLKSDSLAVNTYWWLNHKSLVEMVKKQLEHIISFQLQTQLQRLKELLNKRQVQKYINLDVQIHAAKLSEVNVLSDRLKLIFDANVQPLLGIGNF